MLEELEVVPAQEMGDVLRPPGQQVVDAYHFVALGQRPFAEVGAEEAGAARDEGPAHDRPPAERTGLGTAWGRVSGIPSGRPIET